MLSVLLVDSVDLSGLYENDLSVGCVAMYADVICFMSCSA
jgi:hypothetical protein